MVTRLNQKWEYTTDKLVEALAKPIFILRMSKPFEHENTPMGKGCRKKCIKARKDIQALIKEFGVTYD